MSKKDRVSLRGRGESGDGRQTLRDCKLSRASESGGHSRTEASEANIWQTIASSHLQAKFYHPSLLLIPRTNTTRVGSQKVPSFRIACTALLTSLT